MLFQQIVAIAVLCHTSLATVATIPNPDGAYGIAYATTQLINDEMLDPYAPKEQHRRIMLSAFYPTTEMQYCQQRRLRYMPSGTASIYNQLYEDYGLQNGTFDTLEMTFCGQNAASTRGKNPRYPVVLFSPGLGDSRLLYSSIGGALAARGFVVVTIDHPYDAAVVEYLDGSLVLGTNITTQNQVEAALKVRTEDLVFVVGQLHNCTITQSLFSGLYGALNLREVFTAGHSLGGATAAAAMLEDRRIRGGIDLDGTFFGSVVQSGLDRPFMIFAHEGKNQSTDESWASVWPRLNNSKVAVSIIGTKHGSYTDFPLLLDVLGLRDDLPANEIPNLIGTVSGNRLVKILATYMSAFFGFVGGQPPRRLLQKSVAQFPEVEILDSSLEVGEMLGEDLGFGLDLNHLMSE